MKTHPPYPWYWRLWLWLKYGPDSYCDDCGRKTWWNGNLWNANGIEVVICDHCHSKIANQRAAELSALRAKG